MNLKFKKNEKDLIIIENVKEEILDKRISEISIDEEELADRIYERMKKNNFDLFNLPNGNVFDGSQIINTPLYQSLLDKGLDPMDFISLTDHRSEKDVNKLISIRIAYNSYKNGNLQQLRKFENSLISMSSVSIGRGSILLNSFDKDEIKNDSYLKEKLYRLLSSDSDTKNIRNKNITEVMDMYLNIVNDYKYLDGIKSSDLDKLTKLKNPYNKVNTPIQETLNFFSKSIDKSSEIERYDIYNVSSNGTAGRLEMLSTFSVENKNSVHKFALNNKPISHKIGYYIIPSAVMYMTIDELFSIFEGRELLEKLYKKISRSNTMNKKIVYSILADKSEYFIVNMDGFEDLFPKFSRNNKESGIRRRIYKIYNSNSKNLLKERLISKNDKDYKCYIEDRLVEKLKFENDIEKGNRIDYLAFERNMEEENIDLYKVSHIDKYVSNMTSSKNNINNSSKEINNLNITNVDVALEPSKDTKENIDSKDRMMEFNNRVDSDKFSFRKAEINNMILRLFNEKELNTNFNIHINKIDILDDGVLDQFGLNISCQYYDGETNNIHEFEIDIERYTVYEIEKHLYPKLLKFLLILTNSYNYNNYYIIYKFIDHYRYVEELYIDMEVKINKFDKHIYKEVKGISLDTEVGKVKNAFGVI